MNTRPLLDVPAQVTESASSFYRQHYINMAQFSITEMITRSHEQFVTRVSEALATDNKRPREVFPEIFAEVESMKDRLEEIAPAQLEVAVSRSVDNFLSYISDILTQAIVTRPELLKTQEKVTYEEVLTHGSLQDFVQWAAESRVNQLSFKGLEHISEEISKRLGLALHTEDADWAHLKMSVAVRNLSVHRRLKVDEKFLRAAPDSPAQKGEIFEIPRPMLAETMKCTMRIVRDFDARVAQKFRIPLLVATEEAWYKKFNPHPHRHTTIRSRDGDEPPTAIDA